MDQNLQQLFDNIYAQYKSAVYSYVCYLTKNSDEAEDLFQETWLRVVQKWKQIPQIREFKSWILSILINLHRDQLRKKKIRKLLFLSNSYDSNVDQPQLDQFETQDFNIAFGRAVSRLPSKQKRIFLLKIVEGFKHREISELLGIPKGTVKSILHKAVKQIQKELSGYQLGHEDSP